MAYKGVEYLDSKKLLEAAKKLEKCLQRYKDLIKDITRVTDELLVVWHGEGRTAFEKDYSTIFRQLSDVSDIMYDLYDSIVDADATYVQTDEDIAKGLTMNE